MSAIYLKHPVHGNKVAISEDEAKADEKNGWTRYEVDGTAEVPVASAASASATGDSNALAGSDDPARLAVARLAYKEKFGKEAHRNKSLKTLTKDLEAA